MPAAPKLFTTTVTSPAVARHGACSQVRRASSCEGLGKRKRSVTNITNTSASQMNIAAISRGIHQAGSSHRKPSRRATKNRAPKAKGGVRGGVRGQPLPAARGYAASSSAIPRREYFISRHFISRHFNFGTFYFRDISLRNTFHFATFSLQSISLRSISFRIILFRNFDGRNDLGDDLVGG